MSAPLNVLFLIRSLHVGGAERQLTLLLLGMHAAGHRVRVAVFYSGGPFERELQAAGVPVYYLNKSGRWDLLPFFFRLVQLIRTEKPDILHGYLPMANILLWLARYFSPACRVVWGVRVSDFNPGQYGWMGSLEGRLETWLASQVNLIICNSWKGLALVRQRGFPLASTACIPNGVDCTLFQPDALARSRMRQQWMVEPDAFLVGLVGRLDPVKNHPGFIAVAARLAIKYPALIFTCIGPGEPAYLQALQDQAAQAGVSARVLFTGACHDMPAAYNALDLFVSASFSEGSPNVLGEAMACGVFAVSTDVGDAAWLMSDYGVIVPPGDADTLCAAIEQAYLLRDLPRKNPRDRIVSVFDSTLLEQRTSSVLAKVMSGNYR